MILTSADLSTASVQLGLGTLTPMLNVGSASGDFTGDGIHIKADTTNIRQAFLMLEGASDWPNGAGHGSASIVFADTVQGSDLKLFEIGLAISYQKHITMRKLTDAGAGSLQFIDMDMENNKVSLNPGSADVDIELNSDTKSAWKIDAGTDKIYSELLNDGKSGTPPENFSYLIVNHDTDEVSAYTPA